MAWLGDVRTIPTILAGMNKRKGEKAENERCKLGFLLRSAFSTRMSDGITLRSKHSTVPRAKKRPRLTSPDSLAGPSNLQSLANRFEQRPEFIGRYPELSERFDELFEEVELDLRKRFVDNQQARKVSQTRCSLVLDFWWSFVTI